LTVISFQEVAPAGQISISDSDEPNLDEMCYHLTVTLEGVDINIHYTTQIKI